MSTAYHPEIDGQTERVNMCLETYLRCFYFQHPKKWASWIPQAEWWYNTNYHSSLGMTLYQALYGTPAPNCTLAASYEATSRAVQDWAKKRKALTKELQ